ncbi:hypothetical protein DFP72DRAFT_1069407 [Ephemerocybe angulata]|uniref:MYND-type domain-containing protein n=1 Tax=Ephemerocybe angulata TaxID=980116 RepID=A0A8H6HX63_9AGAR|nr:hypothetical protein DFP72DRAFT_1069407 [Tulosesus angulatus]
MSRIIPKTIRARRLEALLAGVERGSLFDFKGLLEEWPSDITSSKRALCVLLEHLRADRVPELDLRNAGEAAYKLLLCRESFNVLSGVLDRMEKMREDHVRELYVVLQEHLPDLLAWFSFLGENSAVIAPEAATQFGPLADAPTLEKLVDIVLSMWMDSVPDDVSEDDEYLEPDDYNKYVYPIFRTFWSCVKEESTREIVVQKMLAFDKASHRRLAHCFTYRCEEWATTYLDDEDSIDNCSDFVATVMLSQMLSRAVPAFSRILAKSAFAAVVMESAMNFPLVTTKPRVVPIPVQIARLMLYPQPSNAFECLQIVPELLEYGLIDILVHQLLAPRPPGSDPFRDWAGRKPLAWLYHMSYHPRISDALYYSIDRLSEETREVLWKSPNSKDYWPIFRRGVDLYEKAYEPLDPIYPEDEGCIEMITLCDNLEHEAVSGHPIEFIDSVQCSGCQVTVYCSEACQRHDWKAFHRQECARDRLYRINRQLEGGWISHRTRMMLFRVSHRIIESSIPLLNVMPHTRNLKIVVFADHTNYPLTLNFFELSVFLDVAHGGKRKIFSDERSMALIREYEAQENDKHHLIAGIAPFGEYFILTLGRFVERPRPVPIYREEGEWEDISDSNSDEEDSEEGGGSDDYVEKDSEAADSGESEQVASRDHGEGCNGDDDDAPTQCASTHSGDTDDLVEVEMPHLVLANGFVRVIPVIENGQPLDIAVPPNLFTHTLSKKDLDKLPCII